MSPEAFEGRNLAYRLKIIELLAFVIPLLVVFYVFYQNDFVLNHSQILIVISVLILIGIGIVLLRKTFHHFDMTAKVIKRSSEDGSLLDTEENITAEMMEIATSFNKLVRKINNTGIDLDRKSFELNTLKEMMAVVRNRDNPMEMLNIFLEKAILVTGAAHGSILTEEGAGSLKVHQFQRDGDGQGENPESASESESSSIYDYMKSGLGSNQKAFYYSTPSFMSIPVTVHGKLLAVVNLAAPPDREFRSEDEDILRLMLEEICFAIENSRLNHEVRENLNLIRERAELLERHVQDRENTERQLQDVNVRFFGLIQSVPDMISFKDTGGRFLLVNRAFEDIMGLEQEDVIGKTCYEIFKPEMAEALVQSDKQVLRSRMVSRFEHEIDHNGKRLIIDTINTPIYNTTGQIAGIVSVSRDITSRRQVEDLYEVLANSSPVGVYVVQDGYIRFGNPKFREYAGLSERELLGLKATDLVHPDDREFVKASAAKMLKGQRSAPYEYRLNTRGGETRWIMETVIPITYGGEKAVLGNALDFTARRNAEEALRESEQKYMELSITDDLTKLFNSRHFFIQLKSELKRTSRYGNILSIILLDMDNFKQYNDCHGHIEGDKILVRLANVIRKCIRMTDTVCRYGGDEFIIILPETPGPEAVRVAERIRQDFIAERALAEDQRVEVTLSIGVAEYVFNEDMMDFIKRADANMYKAKENGRNQVFFH
ncbi:MAG: diguanylate cyclase [Syntrophaceae bacterium]